MADATEPIRLAAQGLDLVIASADPEAAARFHVEHLGARPEGASAADAAAAVVSFAGQHLVFRPAGTALRTAPRGIYEAIGLRVVGLLVPDLGRVCEGLARAGRRVAEGRGLPGSRPIRFARDVDGCMLELMGLGDEPPPTAPLQVGLTVADAERSRRFYGETLGFTAQPSVAISKRIVRHGFEVGASVLKLWQPDVRPSPRPPESEPGIAAVLLRVPDVERARAQLERRGAPVRGDDVRAGCLRLRDPDGNAIEIVQARV